jgi:hypothetical protein
MIGTFAITSALVRSLSANFMLLLVLVVADAVMALFWLSAMGATARLRSSFNYLVHLNGCYNDGSALNSEHCYKLKKRYDPAIVAGPIALDMLAAIAGMAALELYVKPSIVNQC